MSKKKDVNETLRRAVWEKYASPGSGIVNCYSCCRHVSVWDFVSGHVIPESGGGATDVENLRPVCARCNLLMGTMDLNEYKRRMDEFGVTKTNIELNPNVPVNAHLRNVETKVLDISLELMTEAELKAICTFYNAKMGNNNKDKMNNIKTSPNYDPSTFQNINRMRKVLTTVKSEVIREICEYMKLPVVGADADLIRSILIRDPNFNYVKYCFEDRTSVKKNKSSPVLADNKLSMQYTSFKEQKDEKAMLIIRKDNNTWTTTILATELEHRMTDSVDKNIVLFMSFDEEKRRSKIQFEKKLAKLIIDDPEDDTWKLPLILKKDSVAVENKQESELTLIDNSSLPLFVSASAHICVCSGCNERLTKLEETVAMLVKKSINP